MGAGRSPRQWDAVIFDLVGVIATSPVPRLRAFVDAKGLDPDHVRRWFAGPGAAWSRYECGLLDEAEVPDRLSADAHAQGLRIDVRAFVAEFLGAPQIRPEMVGLVVKLRRSTKVACLTNTVKRGGAPYLFGLPEGAFDVVLASCELGVRKPAAPSFLAASAALGVAPHACLFLDDDHTNVAAAQQLGMDAHVVPHDEPLTAVRSILGLA